MSGFQILESVNYMIEIPTDPKELAILLDNYSRDAVETLGFLEKLAKARGITLDSRAVKAQLVKNWNEE